MLIDPPSPEPLNLPANAALAGQPVVRVVLAGESALVKGRLQPALQSEPGLDLVGFATDARQALELATELRPDVLVLAFDPVGDVMRRFRRLVSSVRILFLSLPEDPLVLARLGVAGSVPRSAEPEEVSRAIFAVASGRGYFVHGTPEPAGPTQRELDVLRLVEHGLTNRAVGAQLNMSARTVEFHLANACAKLGAKSRTAAIHLARRRGWLD